MLVQVGRCVPKIVKFQLCFPFLPELQRIRGKIGTMLVFKGPSCKGKTSISYFYETFPPEKGMKFCHSSGLPSGASLNKECRSLINPDPHDQQTGGNEHTGNNRGDDLYRLHFHQKFHHIAISQAVRNISENMRRSSDDIIGQTGREQYQRQGAIFQNNRQKYNISQQGKYLLRSTDDIIGQTGWSNISGRRNCRYHCSIRCAAHVWEQLLVSIIIMMVMFMVHSS